MKTIILIATYNVKTLSSEDRLTELEEQIKEIKWDIVGLSEIRKPEENIESGHALYSKGN